MRVTACLISASIFLLVTSAPTRIQSQTATEQTSASSSNMKRAIWNGDLPTLRRLLANGVDPLKVEEQGTDSLAPWEWAVVAGNNDALQRLLEKVPKIPTNRNSVNRRLATAAAMNNVVATRELIKRGLPVDFVSSEGKGPTALALAAAGGYVQVMELLLNAGASPRLQDRSGDSPLMAAVRIGSLDAVNVLLKRGADPSQRDSSGRTALIWAARMGRLDVVRALLAAGADINPTDSEGQNALMTATAKGHTDVAAALRDKGATVTGSPVPYSPPPTARVAVEKSIPLLQRGLATWFETQNCGSCHHAPMFRLLAVVARQHGFPIDEPQTVRGRGRRRGANAETRLENALANDRSFDLAWVGHLSAAGGVPRDAIQEANALALAQMQLDDGRWPYGAPRVPISGSPFTVTATGAQVLQMYGPPARTSEMAAQIDRARRWLVANTPKDTQDEVFRMLGLRWTNADEALVRREVDVLKRAQNADGGWTQLPRMNSDAYATGLVLVALHDVGVPATDPIYRRGVDYLLRTQEPDGSWLVHTRAAPQNLYFESGFPHGKFQFISYASSCWATIALIYAA